MGLLNRKNLITAALLVALLLIIYFSMNRTQHGDKAEWLREHAAVVERRGNPERFCIECHKDKRGETMENYCNKCHSINSKHKTKAVWEREHGATAAMLIKQNELGKFCLDCHGKTREAVQNDFCNSCHKERNITQIQYTDNKVQ